MASQRGCCREFVRYGYFPNVVLCKLRFTGDVFLELLLQEACYWHCEGGRLDQVTHEALSKILGLGELLHLIVEQLVTFSGEESFDGGLFYKVKDESIKRSFSTIHGFFEKCEDHFLAPAVNETS